MDLVNFDTRKLSDSGAVMYLRNPLTELREELEHQAEDDKKPFKMFLKLLGRDSIAFQRAFRKLTAATNKKAHEISDEDIAAEMRRNSKAMASITVDGLVFFNGAWITVNADNAKEIYETLPWLVEDVIAFTVDRGNYAPKDKAA